MSFLNQINHTGAKSTSVLSILISPRKPFVNINPRGGLYFFIKFLKLLPGLGDINVVYFTSTGIKSLPAFLSKVKFSAGLLFLQFRRSSFSLYD